MRSGIEHGKACRLRAGIAGLLGAAVLAGMVAPEPATAQGLLGRLKRAVEKVEETTGEAEEATNSAERVLGKFRGSPKGKSQPAAPPAPEPEWNDTAQMGADDGDMGADYGSMDEPPPPRLVLSDRHRLSGRIVELFGDTPSLHGPDFRIGDLSYSLEATGRWELCKDTNYRGQCVVYEGRHDELGRLGGTFSSARYLGPEQ